MTAGGKMNAFRRWTREGSDSAWHRNLEYRILQHSRGPVFLLRGERQGSNLLIRLRPGWKPLWVFVLLFLFFAATGAPAGESAPEGAPSYGYRVVRSHPHDRQAFTQGLAYDGGFLYEGTGLHGRSTLRRVDLASGRVLKEIQLDPALFGEGVAVFGERIVQLTWQSRVGFVYDKSSFRLLDTFNYPHEGWGIAHDGKRLLLSDGTSVVRFLDPKDFRETGRIRVQDGMEPVTGLNELEYVRGDLYANVWPTERIAVIDPRTGRVRAWIDLKGLLDGRDAVGADVLNGIAYDAGGDRLFVTGKFWPKVFEIRRTRKR